ncbi:MAG TPA: hypothetical protein VG796_21705 [Verrucomicrobiales bacterium]|nr:hypothetical protein [Verrucomicrobiales bacterium]
MTLYRPFLCLCSVLVSAAVLKADEAKPDRELDVLEARLQKERATAIHARLTLYTDELNKLLAQYNAASETDNAAAVQEELRTVELAMKRLAAISKGEKEPAAPDEPKPKEPLSDTALAAKRIDAIIARFSKAAVPLNPAAAPSGPPRPRLLKMDKAVKSREHASAEGASYWSYANSYAVWSMDDLVPGEYEVTIRYTGAKSGGKATVRIAKQSFDVTVPVPPKGQGKGELKLTAGTVKITETGTDVRVESKGLAQGASYLWNLEAVILQPVAKRP